MLFDILNYFQFSDAFRFKLHPSPDVLLGRFIGVSPVTDKTKFINIILIKAFTSSGIFHPCKLDVTISNLWGGWFILLLYTDIP